MMMSNNGDASADTALGVVHMNLGISRQDCTAPVNRLLSCTPRRDAEGGRLTRVDNSTHRANLGGILPVREVNGAEEGAFGAEEQHRGVQVPVRAVPKMSMQHNRIWMMRL